MAGSVRAVLALYLLSRELTGYCRHSNIYVRPGSCFQPAAERTTWASIRTPCQLWVAGYLPW